MALVSAQSTKMRVEMAQGAIQSTAEIMSSEYHFVHRNVDPPANQAPLSLAFWAERNYRTSSLASIDAGKERKGFNFAQIVPDPSGATKGDSYNEERAAEELLGEATENLTKLSTTLTVNDNLSRPSNLLPFCANVILFICTICVVDDDVQPPPDMYTCALRLAEVATSPEVRDWLKRNRSAAHYFSFWGFSVLEQVFIQTTRQTKVPALLRLASKRLFNKIPTLHYNLALEAFQYQLKQLNLVTCGGDVLPEPTIYRNSVAKQKRDEAAKNEQAKELRKLVALSTAQNPGQDKTGPGNKTPTGERPPKIPKTTGTSDGDNIWSSTTGLGMPLPQFPPDERACGSFIRKGSICRHGPRCHFAHIRAVDMNEKTRQIWKKHVAATEGMSWNPAAFPPEFLKLTLNVSPAAKPAGTEKSKPAAATQTTVE